jgi:putative ATP-dependent endonuclease of OLD family
VTIGSVDFEPYVRLLLGVGASGVSILDQLVVITDSDPAVTDDDDDEDEDEDDPDRDVGPAPIPRVARLHALAEADPRLRVLVATRTLEADLLGESGNEPVLREVFLAQKPRSKSRWQSFVDAPDPAAAFYQRLRATSGFIAKGQFAHDLAAKIEQGAGFACPPYLSGAIEAALDQ